MKEKSSSAKVKKHYIIQQKQTKNIRVGTNGKEQKVSKIFDRAKFDEIQTGSKIGRVLADDI